MAITQTKIDEFQALKTAFAEAQGRKISIQDKLASIDPRQQQTEAERPRAELYEIVMTDKFMVAQQELQKAKQVYDAYVNALTQDERISLGLEDLETEAEPEQDSKPNNVREFITGEIAACQSKIQQLEIFSADMSLTTITSGDTELLERLEQLRKDTMNKLNVHQITLERWYEDLAEYEYQGVIPSDIAWQFQQDDTQGGRAD